MHNMGVYKYKEYVQSSANNSYYGENNLWWHVLPHNNHPKVDYFPTTAHLEVFYSSTIMNDYVSK